MTEPTCVIWGIPAELSIDGYTMVVNSPRTDGPYIVTEVAPKVSSLKGDAKARLTTWIIDQHMLGNRTPVVDSDTLQRVQNARNLSVIGRRERLMRYLSRRAGHVGDWVGLWGKETPEKLKNKAEMLAWSE